jgi:uncharacterized protein with PIN domain
MERNKSSGPVQMKFVLDTMLGRLAKWLRVLGYDTHYQSYYHPGQLEYLAGEDRHLVTRDKKKGALDTRAVLLQHDTVGEQLVELASLLRLKPDPAGWFLRCLRCNGPLETVPESKARERVPEYVFYENQGRIKVCNRCGRCFWPGSHRARMVKQLHAWGLADAPQGQGLSNREIRS